MGVARFGQPQQMTLPLKGVIKGRVLRHKTSLWVIKKKAYLEWPVIQKGFHLAQIEKTWEEELDAANPSPISALSAQLIYDLIFQLDAE